MVMLETVQRLIGEMTHPIGSLYFNATDNTNPGTLLGFGTWEAFGAGRVLVGKNTSGTFATAGATGGAETVTLTSAQSGLPAHTHPTVGGTGTGGSSYRVHDYASTTNTATGGDSFVPTGNNSAANASSAHTNLQPYIVVYCWKRTA
jgi:type IV secretory pathway TrbL component